MILAVDIGNSDVTIGLSGMGEGEWLHVWRIPSRLDKSELYFGVCLRDYYQNAGYHFHQVKTIVISSVVPVLTDKIENVVRELFSGEVLRLGPEVYAKLPIKVLNPYEVGSDLVSNALAGYTKLKDACIVVDFGTALTFTTVSEIGEMIAVSIAPGLRTAVRALSQNTAKLFDVPLEMPPSALGKNTVTAIQSGILIGYEGLVKNLIANIQKEIGRECPVIATGGLLSIITSLKPVFHSINPYHTLDGLRILGLLLGKNHS